MNDYSIADLAAVTGAKGNGDGFGDGNGAWWLLVLFALLGGFGNNGYGNRGGGGAGGVGGNEMYPWLNQAEQVNDGFRDQMLNTTVNGIQQGVNSLSTQLCNCCGDMQMAMCNGFNATQNAVNQGFNATNMGMMQGFNGVQSQTAQLASDIQLGNAQQTATILAENCADRAALSDGVRDIIASQTAGTQRIIDQLCQDKIDAKNDEIQRLRQQLDMQTLAASQAAQNNFIQQGFSDEVDQLYNRLSNCPVPSMPVYGRTPIFTCPSQNGCGCGCGA
jgi:hypothetical protein